MSSVRERYGEAFWRAHHEAWIESELNQREYCEACGLPLKAFGNWRAKFKAEPQPPARKMLYRRGDLSHALSHGLSHGLSHDLPGSGPIVPPAREGRRRRFSEADKRQILQEAMQPDVRFSEVARRHGIAERVLFQWKQEITPAAATLFATVEITDANAPSDPATNDREYSSGARPGASDRQGPRQSRSSRSCPGRQVLRSPSALQAEPNLRPARGRYRSLDSRELGGRRLLVAGAAAGPPRSACVWINQAVCRRHADPGARSLPRPHQDRPVVGLCARRSTLVRARTAGRRLLLQSRSQGRASCRSSPGLPWCAASRRLCWLRAADRAGRHRTGSVLGPRTTQVLRSARSDRESIYRNRYGEDRLQRRIALRKKQGTPLWGVDPKQKRPARKRGAS
jgi:transposase-like protein